MSSKHVHRCFPRLWHFDDRGQKSDRACDVVEDQKCLRLRQQIVVVGEASVVSHVVEGVQDGDRGLQNPVRHLRFDQAPGFKGLAEFSEQAVQGLLGAHLDALPAAHLSDIPNDEGVEVIEADLGLVRLDRVANGLCEDLEVSSVGIWRESVEIFDRRAEVQAFDNRAGLRDEGGVGCRLDRFRVPDQRRKRPGDKMIRCDLLEAPHSIGLRPAGVVILGVVDRDADCIQEELVERAVREVKDVPATHVEQALSDGCSRVSRPSSDR